MNELVILTHIYLHKIYIPREHIAYQTCLVHSVCATSAKSFLFPRNNMKITMILFVHIVYILMFIFVS